jgi:hypothetical protein
VRAEWEPDELIDAWTLVEGDWELVGAKAGAARLGFSVILKFYEIEGRFPAYPEQVPSAAVDYVASLVKVDPRLFGRYSWRGRTIERHRAQIRKAYGTRPPNEADEDRWAQWLGDEICPTHTPWSDQGWRPAVTIGVPGLLLGEIFLSGKLHAWRQHVCPGERRWE